VLGLRAFVGPAAVGVTVFALAAGYFHWRGASTLAEARWLESTDIMLGRWLEPLLNEQLDPLMAKFSLTNPTFYAEYVTARRIVDSAASHSEEEEPVTVELAKAA
jgi:hypothetical protein